MKRSNTKTFRRDMILKFESASPKPKYKDFAKQHNINVETLKSWIYDSRKATPKHHIVELKPQQSINSEDETQQKITAVQQRLVEEYGYDNYSAQEALNYVTTLLSQE